VGVLDLSSKQERVLTAALDRQCAPHPSFREPVWDGGDVLFAVEDAGNVHLYRVAADREGKPEKVVGGDRWVTAFDVRAGTAAYAVTTPTALPELCVMPAAGRGAEQQLTTIGRAFAAAHQLVAPERFVATSADGTEVEAWIVRPVGFDPAERYPALLNIHGGPFTQYGNRFFDEFHVQSGAGYVVLYANPRGSSGYTEEWGRAIRGPLAADDPGSGWGGVDHEDLVAVVDEALERFPFIDPGRLGVIGGSYGGYMTSWIVGHTTRFAAAVSERAVNNLLTMEHTSDIATVFADYTGVTHLDDPAEYQRQSPITHVRAIETPVLILHSEEDLRCPVEQADQLFVAMRLLGKRVEFVRFPGESHELSRSGAPKHRVQRFEVILEWFDRWLTPRG
jgi:dipeptidyl aminopeptidase/acylaminoacyl peptidase